MSELMLKKLLHRFRRKDYSRVVSEWKALHEESHPEQLMAEVGPLSNRISKKDFYEMVLACLGKNSSLWEKRLGELDLLYVEQYSHMKTWSVFTLEKKTGKQTTVKNLDAFQQKLSLELSHINDFSVSVRVSSQTALWIRISIQDGRPSNPSFFIFHPCAAFILSHGLKAKHSEFIIQALLSTLNYKQINELQLTGSCVNSLLKLCLQKYDKSNASKFLLKDPDIHTTRKTQSKRKRKAPEAVLDDLTNVVNEHSEEIKQHQHIADSQFGKAKLPKLESLKYELKTPFYPIRCVPLMAVHRDQPFHCKVKFSGSDVLEGIKNLCYAGVVQMPLKKHLAKVPALARNQFVLRPKQTDNLSSNALE